MYIGPFGSAGIRNYFSSTLSLGCGPSGNPQTLSIGSDGSVDVAYSTSLSGELNVYGTTMAAPLHRSNGNANGGQYTLTDDETNPVVLFGADDAGTGGRLQVQRNDTYGEDSGIDLNGNWAASGEPALRIIGSNRSANFYMSSLGTSSVRLPQDAVEAAEIMDEPGVTSVSNAIVGLSSSIQTMVSTSIDVPTAGYVLAIGTVGIENYHNTGTATDGYVGISDHATYFLTDSKVRFEIDDGNSEGYYNHVTTIHAIFPVEEADTYTYYFLGQELSGSITARDPRLTLLYIPTTYGSVSARPGGGALPASDGRGSDHPGLTPAEVAAEREAAHATNLARLERELAEIKAELEAMKEE